MEKVSSDKGKSSASLKNKQTIDKKTSSATKKTVSSSSPTVIVTTPIDFNVKSVSDVIRIVKALGAKYGIRTNPQHGTLVGGLLLVVGFVFLRYCSFKFFFFISLIPILYGFIGSRTFALGNLKGQTVLVTGASSGLGRGLAISAAQLGASKVILLARNMNGLQTTAKLVQESTSSNSGSTNNTSKCETVCVSCDVTSNEQIEKLASRCDGLGDIGYVNLLINCAGSGDWKPITMTSPEEAANSMACPYLAAFNMTRALLPSMIAGRDQQEKFHIMNVTSAAAFTGWKGSAAYGSARWAVRGFTEYLRCEVKEHGIGVTLLNPGQIRGTDYFANNQIDFKTLPWLFSKGFNDPRAYDCEMVSSRALKGCIDGECEVHVPGPMAHTTTWLTALMPSVVWYVIDFKPFWVKVTDEVSKKEDEGASGSGSKKDN